MSKNHLLKFTFFILCIFCIFIFCNQALANKNFNESGIVYWHGDVNQKKIALTFDDGPNSLYTPRILDILKKYKVKATFFLIGKNVEAYPKIAKRIADEGHCIGNHSYSHPDFILELNGQIEQEIKKSRKCDYECHRH